MLPQTPPPSVRTGHLPLHRGGFRADDPPLRCTIEKACHSERNEMESKNPFSLVGVGAYDDPKQKPVLDAPVFVMCSRAAGVSFVYAVSLVK